MNINKHFGIYSILCIPTKQRYIGKTRNNFRKRYLSHKSRLIAGTHTNKMQTAWNKYGEKNFKFEILVSYDVKDKDKYSERYLTDLEEEYIAKYDACDNGLNATKGGDTHIVSEESKIKRSNSLRGYVKSKEHCEHLSEALTGFKRNPEQIEKCRKANQGSKQKTAKYTEKEVYDIRVDRINGYTYHELFDKYNYIKEGYIRTLCSDTRWRHVRPDGWDEYLKGKKVS